MPKLLKPLVPGTVPKIISISASRLGKRSYAIRLKRLGLERLQQIAAENSRNGHRRAKEARLAAQNSGNGGPDESLDTPLSPLLDVNPIPDSGPLLEVSDVRA